ncbi:MAG: triose-phosphate isomerase [Demequinaceae bacterium]|nr:triose-phosphate isomerase [Demequinaceae bacterium]
MTRTPLIAGNWKLNLDHLEATHAVQKLAWLLRDAKHDYSEVEVAVLPTFTSLRSVQTLIDADQLPIRYGSQDISAHSSGAYTGEISGGMLAALGVTYSAIGHSERRQYHGEDEAMVNAKVKAAFSAGIVPILCIGEGLDIRKEGRQVEYTLAQLDGALAEIPAEKVSTIVIAYEPVWAIGTGEVATPADAEEVCGAIRVRLAQLYSDEVAKAIRILYGGSVKSGNIAAIMAEEDVDGVLVGGASLDPEEFSAIVRYRSHVTG